MRSWIKTELVFFKVDFTVVLLSKQELKACFEADSFRKIQVFYTIV